MFCPIIYRVSNGFNHPFGGMMPRNHPSGVLLPSRPLFSSSNEATPKPVRERCALSEVFSTSMDAANPFVSRTQRKSIRFQNSKEMLLRTQENSLSESSTIHHRIYIYIYILYVYNIFCDVYIIYIYICIPVTGIY
jgi:hypothetical protein